MIGVGNMGIGEFTKFQRIKVTPSSNVELSLTHNLGVLPKVVIFTSTQEFVDTQYILSGVADQNTGGYTIYNTSGNILSGLGMAVTLNEIGSSNSIAYYTTTNVVIRRNSASRYFNPNAEYTVDLYA